MQFYYLYFLEQYLMYSNTFYVVKDDLELLSDPPALLPEHAL